MSFFQDFYKGFKGWGLSLSTIVNTSLLLIAYLLGVGITSLFARGFGKHFMDLKPKKKSYWIDYNLTRRPLDDYYRQF